MARFKSILGKIEGRIGNTSLYTTKDGQQVIRKKPSSRKPSSEAQEAWETAFATTMEARKLFVPAIHYGFPGGAKGEDLQLPGLLQQRGERGDPLPQKAARLPVRLLPLRQPQLRHPPAQGRLLRL